MVATAESSIRISDRYTVGALLGPGLGSRVFYGEDTVLKRKVAIKLVPPEYQAAYRAALAATARIGHPAFIGIFDALKFEGQLAIIEELINGQRFAEMAQAHLSAPSVAKMGRQVALALAHAHRQGITHGDLTPAALFRDQWGAMRLNNVLLPPNADYFAAASRLLKPGEDAWVVTEPLPRDDLRALGVMLWLMLAGRDAPPAEATGLQSDWQLIGREVPADLRDLIERLIDPDHPHALADAEVAVAAFGTVLQQEEARKPRRLTPPWAASASIPDAARTNPTVAAKPPEVSTPISAPTKPVPALPGVIGSAIPRNGDNDVTWVNGAPPHLASPVGRNYPTAYTSARPGVAPPATRGRFDYALWAALALALFVFWLIVGFLIPGFLGK